MNKEENQIKQLNKRIDDLITGIKTIAYHKEVSHDISWICGSLLEDDNRQAAIDCGEWKY